MSIKIIIEGSIQVNHHFPYSDAINIKEHFTQLTNLINKNHQIMSQKNDEIKAHIAEAFSAINESTNNIAADIDNLAAQVAAGLTEAESTDIANQLTAVSETLKGVAAKTPDGQPTPPVA